MEQENLVPGPLVIAKEFSSFTTNPEKSLGYWKRVKEITAHGIDDSEAQGLQWSSKTIPRT